MSKNTYIETIHGYIVEVENIMADSPYPYRIVGRTPVVDENGNFANGFLLSEDEVRQVWIEEDRPTPPKAKANEMAIGRQTGKSGMLMTNRSQSFAENLRRLGNNG